MSDEAKEQEKRFKIFLANLKYEIGEIVEEKIRKVFEEREKPKRYIEVGYR